MMKSQTTFNPKRDLPYLAAISQTILYTWAGVTLLGKWGWIPGAATGLLVSVTMAYASSQYVEVAKERRRFVLFGMVLLGAMSPIVIGTSMYLDLPASVHPFWRGVVGAALGLIPDVSVFLTGFVAGKGLIAKEQPAATDTATDIATQQRNAPKPAKKPAKVAQTAAKLSRQPVTDDALLRRMTEKPGESYTELAQHFGVSRTAITKRVKKLLAVP